MKKAGFLYILAFPLFPAISEVCIEEPGEFSSLVKISAVSCFQPIFIAAGIGVEGVCTYAK